MAAVLVGLMGGLSVSILQEFTTTPLILQAEEFEQLRSGELEVRSVPKAAVSSLSATHLGISDGSVDIGSRIERVIFTTMANILTGIGFALILISSIALYGRSVEGRRGVVWGVAGFAIFSLAPALGLPPEVPGSSVTELGPRQSWWFFCVAATGVGLWAVVFGRGIVWVLGGLCMVALPHVVGAPHSNETSGAPPSELAAQFVAASLATAAIFWCTLGWLSGVFWMRLNSQ